MSPASQGALEVERYIGSCLISSSVRAGLHGKPVSVCRKQEQSATVRGGKARGCYNGGQGYPGLAADQQQCQVQYGGPGGWTGAPLISMTSSPRRCNQRSSPSLGQQQQQQQQQQTCGDQQQMTPSGGHLHKSPLSRLAIHTQGAPLILAGRFYNRGKVHGSSNNNNNNNNNNNSGNCNGSANAPASCGNVATGNYVHGSPSVTSNASGTTRPGPPASRVAPQRSAEVTAKKTPTMVPANSKTAATNADCPSAAAAKENAGSASIANIDSLSIASDESSGSNNSENSLPRIIKPRKRRKKDRKPPNNVVAGGVEAVKPEESQAQRQQPAAGCGVTTGEQSGVIGVVKSYAPTCYEARIYEAAAPHLRNYRRPPPVGHRENIYGGGGCRVPSMQAEMADGIRQQRYAHHHHRHHVQVKVLDDNRNVIAAPMRATAPPNNYRHHHHHHHHHHHANDNGNGNLPPRRYVHEYAGESCEAVAAVAASGDGPGPCQCRYCDPASLIWDVDRNGYAPFLPPAPAPPPPPPPSSSSSSSGVEYRGHFGGQMPLFLTPCASLQERPLDRMFDEHSRLRDDGPRDAGPASGPASGVVLRRSWSDPTSYFSYAGEEIAAPSRDVGVIGDRGGQSESGRHKRALWRGDSIGGAPMSSSGNANAASPNAAGGAAASPKGLEVSTEIITSPNGHRDLEIKFYSSPSPAERLAPEEDKSSSSLAGEADDDDNGEDDFSDIWSYHESKLQQDFRTLLQAEE